MWKLTLGSGIGALFQDQRWIVILSCHSMFYAGAITLLAHVFPSSSFL
jgi:hypothetical protein